jgi:hypothetical protein
MNWTERHEIAEDWPEKAGPDAGSAADRSGVVADCGGSCRSAAQGVAEGGLPQASRASLPPAPAPSFPFPARERAAERSHCNAPRPGSKARGTPEHCGLRGLIAHRGRLRGASTQLVAPWHARRHSTQKGDARRIVTDASETPTIARWRDFRGPARWEGTEGKPRQRARLGAADEPTF